MITPGHWQLAAPERREPLTRDHPGIPDQPAYIYALCADQEVVIAHVMKPTVWQNIEGEPDEVPFGDPEDNAKLMTFSPILLRFVQLLAAQVEGGIITAQYREEAKALLKQLAEVEVTDESNRW